MCYNCNHQAHLLAVGHGHGPWRLSILLGSGTRTPPTASSSRSLRAPRAAPLQCPGEFSVCSTQLQRVAPLSVLGPPELEAERLQSSRRSAAGRAAGARMASGGGDPRGDPTMGSALDDPAEAAGYTLEVKVLNSVRPPLWFMSPPSSGSSASSGLLTARSLARSLAFSSARCSQGIISVPVQPDERVGTVKGLLADRHFVRLPLYLPSSPSFSLLAEGNLPHLSLARRGGRCARPATSS